jgi:two-component system chemotaxis response regulator CheB
MLCVVLTGMGADGREGARAVKSHGGTVFAQDRESSAVWGMPGSVVEAGLADKVVPLDRMADAIAAWVARAGATRSAGVGAGAGSMPLSRR